MPKKKTATKKSSTNVTKGKAENLKDRKRQIKAVKNKRKNIMKELFKD